MVFKHREPLAMREVSGPQCHGFKLTSFHTKFKLLKILRVFLNAEDEGGRSQHLSATHRHCSVHVSTRLYCNCWSSSSYSMWNGSEIWIRSVKMLKNVN